MYAPIHLRSSSVAHSVKAHSHFLFTTSEASVKKVWAFCTSAPYSRCTTLAKTAYFSTEYDMAHQNTEFYTFWTRAYTFRSSKQSLYITSRTVHSTQATNQHTSFVSPLTELREPKEKVAFGIWLSSILNENDEKAPIRRKIALLRETWLQKW